MVRGVGGVHLGAGRALKLLREVPRVGEGAEHAQPRRAVRVLQRGEVLGLGGGEVAPHLTRDTQWVLDNMYIIRKP